MSKDKEERKLQKVKIGLMRQPKFALWSGVMMVGKTILSDDVPTACTNGRDEMYGRELVKTLNDKELGFVVLHETLHKAFRHLTTWTKLWKDNPQMANMACDYVINLMLVEMDPNEQFIAFPMKDGKRIGLYDIKYKGMNAKQVFDILKKEQQDGGGEGEGAGGEGGGESAGGFDEHDWEGAKELSTEEKHELEREIDQALRQGQIAQKKVGGDAGDIDRALGELLAPKVDWREVLREFVSTVCASKDASSWRRVNRRFIGSDVYLPTMIGEKVGAIAVGVDTSGSIGGDDINRFLSEVQSIANDVHPETLDLMYWDSRVAGHEVYGDNGADLDTLATSTKPKGGGGTDPTAMMKYMKEKHMKPQCIIMLTDGCIGDWGSDWESPVLWVICNPYSKGITAPIGKTVTIEG